jgi:hypothetical protein
MIWEFAGDFIRQGTTVEERQARLTAASSAWNIASSLVDKRQRLVDGFMAQYQRFNPTTDAVGLAAIRTDMEKLIQAKLKLFPADARQIINAQLIRVGNSDRIEVASVAVQ